MRVNTSAPITSTERYAPFKMNWLPVASPYRKPLHTAFRSKAPARGAPRACCTSEAVAGMFE